MKVSKEILAKADLVEDYNSNNGWGFGGMIGKKYTFDSGLVIYKGKRNYRRSEPINELVVYFQTPDDGSFRLSNNLKDLNGDIYLTWGFHNPYGDNDVYRLFFGVLHKEIDFPEIITEKIISKQTIKLF